jgi:hypothetical protein
MTPRPLTAAAATLLVVALAAPSGQETLRARLIGDWRLVTVESHVDGQPPQATLGPAPVGLLSYTADGRMLAHLTLAERPAVRVAEATPSQLQTLARYTAYFGTFSVDERAGTVTHHRDGAFLPGERDFVRHASLNGPRLVLTTPATMVDGRKRHTTITWERLPPAPAAAGFEAAARHAVAGTWELVDHRTIQADGEVRHAFGPSPRGVFVFDADGYTTVQIVDPARVATAAAGATTDELRTLWRGYLAYFGRYDVDLATRTIVVHTTADLNPLNTGVDQIRVYALDGDTMVLQPPAQAGGAVSRITWRRRR